MGSLNLLKANFTGQVGNMVGQSWKGKPILKAKVEGKAKPTVKQTENVRAFEALNRLAAVTAKHWWKYFHLSDKKMHRHNAVASHFKPLIADHSFFPPAFIDVLTPDKRILLQTPEQSTPGGFIAIRFTIPDRTQLPAGTHINAIVVDSMGYCGYPFSALAGPDPFMLVPPSPQLYQLFVIAFCSYPTENGQIIFGGNAMEVKTMQYSLDEQLTNDTWLDGSPIYQKTIDFGRIPSSAGNKSVPHNINNLKMIIGYEAFGYAYNNPTTGAMLNSGYTVDQTGIYSNSTMIRFFTGGTGYGNNYNAYITIRYIKTS